MKGLVRFRNRKGFALILVFSLASIVLLLGLSLVSLTQVETASSQYDQGLRVARANARLALQMAIGDLQTLTGPDQRITATADGVRVPADDDFNDASSPGTSGVYQPFWTGVWDNDNTSDAPRWLVTRPLDATYTIDTGTQDADPFASDLGVSSDLVKLVGAGTAKPETPSSGQTNHDVWVPREPLLSDNIVGLATSEQATVGHYAYWVGDNGVKASYLLEDLHSGIVHDGYDNAGSPTDEHARLKQMLVQRYLLEVDGRAVDATNARIDSIVSELVLRQEEDPGLSFLGTFTQNDVLRRFHDYTGASIGLLADTVRGGLREDLSDIHLVNTGDTGVDDLVNNYLMPYLNVADVAFTSPTELTRSYPIAAGTTFGGGGPTPNISPVISEFHLVIRMSAKDLETAPGPPPISSPVYGQFGMSVELWNPYSSSIEGADLRIRIDNPNTTGLTVTYHDNGIDYVVPVSLGLDDIMNGISEVILDTTGTNWNPGEIRVFSGSYDPGAGYLSLTPGAAILTSGSFDYTIPVLASEPFVSSSMSIFADDISLFGPIWSPEVSLRTSGGDVLHRSQLSGVSFYEMRSSPTPVGSPSESHLSYKWELRNPDIDWRNYDPRSGLITNDLIMEDFIDPVPTHPAYVPESMFYFEYPGGGGHPNPVIQSSVNDLLGFNSDTSIENNIPLLELPRQEFLSLGALQMAEFPSGLKAHLGASDASISPVAPINEVFDRFFLSTVPQGTTTWTPSAPLPNSRMQPVQGTAIGDLQDPDSAEHLYLEGAFNVNSTSIEAWASLLKGVRLGNWAYDDPLGSTPVAGQSEVDVTGEYQFLRFGQTAEETWLGSYDMSDLGKSREFFRKGMRSLTDAEVESLATEIVELIRTRRQAVIGDVGPFVSLEDFVDSGVIEGAIAAAGLNDAVRTDLADPLTELAYASSFLTQQDVLAAIAPFLSARSDTFVIRAYGDSVNPFDATKTVARAYCEAIVQRVHAKDETEYDVTPGNQDPMVPTLNTPGNYGREYRVIAFRWLTGDEI